MMSLHKKQSFPLRNSAVNMIESAGNYGFGHIYIEIFQTCPWANLEKYH